jgi:hypothetical protein
MDNRKDSCKTIPAQILPLMLLWELGKKLPELEFYHCSELGKFAVLRS